MNDQAFFGSFGQFGKNTFRLGEGFSKRVSFILPYWPKLPVQQGQDGTTWKQFLATLKIVASSSMGMGAGIYRWATQKPSLQWVVGVIQIQLKLIAHLALCGEEQVERYSVQTLLYRRKLHSRKIGPHILRTAVGKNVTVRNGLRSI